jgi:hypothetical protein
MNRSSLHAFAGFACIEYDISFIADTGGSGDLSEGKVSEKRWK